MFLLALASMVDGYFAQQVFLLEVLMLDEQRRVQAYQAKDAESARHRGCAATAAPPMESPSQIRDAISGSEELANELHQELSALEARLSTGLTPIAPAAARSGDAGGRPEGSPILERVQSHRGVLAGAIARLQDLRRRVEL